MFNELGFTALESEIYVYLLQHSPATGYKIAKGIGRSFTNTYKALSGLQSKGTILVDEGDTFICRAVPIEELMDQMEARLRVQRERIVTSVNQLPLSKGDHRVYHMAMVDQVYERFRRMLLAGEERVLAELFPEPCARLRSTVEEAAAKGLNVAARVYAHEVLEGVRMIHSPFGELNEQTWNSQWLALFVDGRQFLLAHLESNGRGVYEAIWSANPFIARAFYSYVNSDFHHYSFYPFLQKKLTADFLQHEYDRLQDDFPVGGDLGFKDLVSFFPSTKEESTDRKGE
ncbi:MAG: hypothetical protein KJ645_04310 [Planctomycetes bacterium]|nr:hypothetical protein [Planctomycetota bacterium]